jgi:hypothetical protein
MMKTLRAYWHVPAALALAGGAFLVGFAPLGWVLVGAAAGFLVGGHNAALAQAERDALRAQVETLTRRPGGSGP